jgi:hypothetical protein
VTRTTLGELATIVRDHNAEMERRSIRRLTLSLAHLERFFGRDKLAREIDLVALSSWKARRNPKARRTP